MVTNDIIRWLGAIALLGGYALITAERISAANATFALFDACVTSC